METEFTPWLSLAGGLLIGAAAVALMALLGRILGATGIVGGLINPSSREDQMIRLAMIVGMGAAPLALFAITGDWPQISVPVSATAMVIGGVIVGFGASFGGGCTSGHGVCGNARFSRRSMVATAVFMVAAFATVFVIRHVIGASA